MTAPSGRGDQLRRLAADKFGWARPRDEQPAQLADDERVDAASRKDVESCAGEPAGTGSGWRPTTPG